MLNIINRFILWLKNIFHIDKKKHRKEEKGRLEEGMRGLEEEKRSLKEEKIKEERRRLEEEKKRLENEKWERAEVEEKRRLEEEKKILEEEGKRKEKEERIRFEIEKKKHEEKKRFEEERIKEERRRLEEEKKRLENEKWERAEVEEKRRLEEEEGKKVVAEEKKQKEQKKRKKEEEIDTHEEKERRKMEEENRKIDEEEGKKPPKDKETEKNSEIKEETKTRKPYKKKAPTEERKKEHKKPSEDEKKVNGLKRAGKIDLGNIERKKVRLTTERQRPAEVSIKRPVEPSKRKETPTRVESPYVEIDLDEAKVFLIIPKQQFETNTVNNIPPQLNYKLELNRNEQTISVRVNNNKQGIVTVEERRIDLEQSLKNLNIVYPDELQDRVYSYQHSNEILYPFIAIGNNRGRMHYLYDEKGNINSIPRKDIWLLLKKDFELNTKENIFEFGEKWFWENYQQLGINLKETNELVIKHNQNGIETKIPCKSSFSMEGDGLIEDDFKKQMPLFTGNNIKIKAPTLNPSGWVIWIQNKQAGYKVITDNWTEDKPLELKLSDDLPCKCGEFQVDICEQDDRIPIDTLFFRYIPSLQLNFPRNLIIPDPNIGHKQEIIKILLERDFQDWELKVDEKIQHKHIENGYQVELLPEQDIFCFSLLKQDKPETETSFKITVPRLKWRTSENKTWYDKPLQIKKDELIAGTDFYLTICTNDFDTKYDLSAILETNDRTLQETKFIRKGMEYILLLNQFYDTIKKNEDKNTLNVQIRKAKTEESLGQVDVIHFSEITKEKPMDKPPKQSVSFKYPKEKDIKNMRPRVKDGRREGKGFSRQEIIKAGLDIDDIRRLHILLDKRRKSVYLKNVEILKSLTEVSKNGNRSN